MNPWEDLLDSPARVGFGKGATGGAGGELYRVTTLKNTGPGSLRDALSKGPRWVVFDVGGIFRPASKIKPASNITIDGRRQSVIIEKNGLDIAGRDNLIVHALHFRKATEDAIGIYKSTNVWIDHCTLEDCGDGLIDVTAQSRGVTVSWCRLRDHNKAMLVGASDTETKDVAISLTVHHCQFERTIRRNPYLRFGRVHMFNNLWREWGEGTGGDCVNSTLGGQMLLENNVFVAGRNKTTARVTIPGWNEAKGYIKERGNLLLNGARPPVSHQPERVFEASDEYSYAADVADQALIDLIESEAGCEF